MKILKNYDLKSLNTFGVSAKAKFFVIIKNEIDLKKLWQSKEFKNNKKLFLGGGSNILFTKNLNSIVILNNLKGIKIINQGIKNNSKKYSKAVYIKAMSGELWHDLVLFAINHNYWGIENLSLIPGTVGGAPIQNIGAYGMEIKDILENLEAINIQTGERKIFSKDECGFGYRDSIFKNKLKDKYFIFSVTLKLKRNSRGNIVYKSLLEYIKENKINIKNPKNISDAVCAIRQNIFPDTKILGNAGSFFKNVFITKKMLKKLLKTYKDMPYFSGQFGIKVPSAWLIEQCGFKGFSNNKVGVSEKHALILINKSKASGKDIKKLADKIINCVYKKFDIVLEPEINIL